MIVHGIYKALLPKLKIKEVDMEIKVSKEEFERFFEERVQKCREVLIEKAKEYANDEDRMKNFNTAGRMLNLKPYQVAFLYMMKHFESIYEIVIEDKYVSPKVWDEKIGNLINYLFLIDAMKRKEMEEDQKVYVKIPEGVLKAEEGNV